MFHHLSIYLGVLLVPLVALAVIGFVIHRRIQDARFQWWFALGLLAFSLGCYLAVMYIDPGSYWTWFRD